MTTYLELAWLMFGLVGGIVCGIGWGIRICKTHNKIGGLKMIAIALINCVAIICFTVLAVIFGHWWIALFAILFVFGVKTENKK